MGKPETIARRKINMSSQTETFEFQTEAKQLLDLMIHSVYSNCDIFLRELISNSSDAIDKRRFEALKQPELLDEETEFEILIEPDSEKRTLSVHDNGIGMSREEVQELIGTIAKSGSKEFLRRMKESREQDVSAELIGQFGVGFYSSFMVAEKVTLLTRRAGEEKATLWESSGEGSYTLQEADRDTAGTTVTLHLKPADAEDGLQDYTQEWVIREIVKKYSDFVAYPIRMDIERTEVEKDDEGKPVEGAEEKTVVKRETLNSMKAIWLRDKDEVTEEEYTEFYKHISHDWNDPLDRIQAKIEGTLEYRLLLYIPAKAPFDLFYHTDRREGVHLYVKRVFIMDDCRELLPEYLRFIRGVVDSEDLSLNISREMLQQNRQIQRMNRGIINKVLSELKTMKEKDEEKYLSFWAQFGRVLKEGIFQDFENQETLLDLALFPSTSDEEQLTTLQAYIDRMKPDQDTIYYMTGETRKKIEASPHLEAFREKGYEVLLLSEPVDEIWVQSVQEYKDRKFQSAGKGMVELGSEEEKKAEEEKRKEKQESYATLLECLKEKLDEYVKEVRVSARLTASAACLVADAQDMTPQLEQMMKAMGQEMPPVKRILEVNPDHPIMAKLQEVYEKDSASPDLDNYASLLYGQAVLAEGGQLPDPGRFSKLVSDLMVKAIA
jgi:molecular chaperone HtpG